LGDILSNYFFIPVRGKEKYCSKIIESTAIIDNNWAIIIIGQFLDKKKLQPFSIVAHEY